MNAALLNFDHNAVKQGTSYDIGDFTLRVANILLGSTYKGLLLEVGFTHNTLMYSVH